MFVHSKCAHYFLESLLASSACSPASGLSLEEHLPNALLGDGVSGCRRFRFIVSTISSLADAVALVIYQSVALSSC